MLSGRNRFPNANAVVKEFRRLFEEFSKTDTSGCFYNKWFEKMNKYIEAKGEYFEDQ